LRIRNFGDGLGEVRLALRIRAFGMSVLQLSTATPLIPIPAVDEREQQSITPDVSFHTMMQDMQQRMDSMATAIGTLNVELNNSRQAS
jgi:Ca2+-dependent lipid-binding protein